MSYSLTGYLGMVANSERFNANKDALQKAIEPGCVVLEIGAGIGVFAMLACQLGARRVYAVESNDAIQVARDIARANNFSDRIEFIQGTSTRVTLPEPADVVLSDLRGVNPLFYTHLPSVIDARERLLKPGGILIPMTNIINLAVVESRASYPPPENLDGWVLEGMNLRPAQSLLVNRTSSAKKINRYLTEPARWVELDYRSISSPNCSGDVEWTVTESGTAHGLAMWFDATLIPGVGFSSGPGKTNTSYGTTFLPWGEPVSASIGDRVKVSLNATLRGEHYAWGWHSRVYDGNTSALKADFRQSTLLGEVVSPEKLKKRAAGHVPTLTDEGRIQARILSRLRDGVPLGKIAEGLAEQYPERFPSWTVAMAAVGDLSVEFGE
jgi:2-polyprenyl-3-methyl-5-hydroxy-6-metoxy-1,4-benzoquinol methylase